MQKQPLTTISTRQEWRRQLEGMGYANDLLRQSSLLAERGPDYLSGVICPAVRAGRIQFYFDAEGRCAAYVIWALLPPVIEDSLLAGELLAAEQLLPEAEGRLWLIDLVAPRGHVMEVLADLRDRVFCNEHSLRYFRIKHGRRIVKEVTRDPRLNFFRPVLQPTWHCTLEACGFCRPRWEISAT